MAGRKKKVPLVRHKGQWTGETQEYGRVAVIHHSLYRPGELYCQDKGKLKRQRDWEEAVRSNEVVAMQKDKPGTLEADGYVALWRRSEIVEDETQIMFKLVDRLENIG